MPDAAAPDDRLALLRAMRDGNAEARRTLLGLCYTEMRRLGAEGPSFETIVASGPNAGLPHHRPDGRRMVEGDLVVLDFGALVDGYHSDMTRTAMLGDPSPEQAELIELVTAAQALGVAAVRTGVPAVEVDAACRDAITAAGWGERFTHGTGHGIGLRISSSLMG